MASQFKSRSSRSGTRRSYGTLPLLLFFLPTTRPDGTNLIFLTSQRDAWVGRNLKRPSPRSVGTFGFHLSPFTFHLSPFTFHLSPPHHLTTSPRNFNFLNNLRHYIVRRYTFHFLIRRKHDPVP